MSSSTPNPTQRQTRSAALPASSVVPTNVQNHNFNNKQAQFNNSQSAINYSRQSSSPPRTPQKAVNHGQRNVSVSATADSTTKPKSRGKNRPRNATTTPAIPKTDRKTPPLTGGQSNNISSARGISTPSAPAFAGPTFHASPAPSALPIPSFYSKSIPDSPSLKVTLLKKDESASSGSDSSSPPLSKVLATDPKHSKSALDIFFKADREEKARARSASSYKNSSSDASGPFQPPFNSPPHDYVTPGSQTRTGPGHFSSSSCSNMFAMELDGNNFGKPYGPAFSTPYSERINAARSTSSLLSLAQTTPEQHKPTDRSEALKSLLFSRPNPPVTTHDSPFYGVSPPTSASGNRNNATPSRQQYNNFPYFNDTTGGNNTMRGTPRSSGLRQEVTPTKTPVPTPERMDPSFSFLQTPSRNIKENGTSSRRRANNFTSNISSSNVNASPSATPSSSQNADIRNMEESLRRILKLEPSSGVFGGGNISATYVPIS
jgi:hypothetical protein